MSFEASHVPGGHMPAPNKEKDAQQEGVALLITLLALFLLSLLGLYLTLNANTELQISDNYETQIQATYAALAGLNHARALVRGLAFDDLLKGPDGVYSTSAAYLSKARKPDFRNPLSWSVAQSLNVFNPALDFSTMPDDGLISTGFYGGSAGTVLIPMAGIGLASRNPYGPGDIVTSRYFVKVTDNNSEPSEISGDPSDNPFVDGDGIVIVRSIGISKTFSESVGLVPKLNSIAVYEARIKRLSTFDLGPALVVIGNQTSASFSGTFLIDGNQSSGIGTIDTNAGDVYHPDQIIRAAALGHGSIIGGTQPNPSIRDISGQIGSNPDWALLLNPRYLWNFVHVQAPKFADNFFGGDQHWSDGSAPYAGSYDVSKPYNAPGQDPKITVVDGNLYVTGGFTGGGLLIVTGNLFCSGPYAYNGLVLVLGAGNLVAQGSGQGINGGLLVASLTEQSGGITFVTPGISVSGYSRFLSNRDAVKAAIALIPVSQISFREIAGSDP
jgi:hypothetical protein